MRQARSGLPLRLLLASALATLAGCATTETTVVTLPPVALPKSSWIGHDVTDVISKWGPASQREADGRGGQILTYDKTQTTLSESNTAPGIDLPSVPVKTTPIKKVRARFWVDPQKKVYKIWFSDDVYEKGEDVAPSAHPESDDN